MRNIKKNTHLHQAAAALLLAALLLSACGEEAAPAPELQDPVKLEPDTAVVQYEDIFNLTPAEGCILPTSIPVAFPADGKIESVAVAPGQTVKKGDLLATMDMETVLEKMDALNLQLKEMVARDERNNSSLQMTAEIYRAELASLNAAGDSYAAAVKEVDLWEALMTIRHAEANQEVERQKLQSQIDELQATLDTCGELRAPADGVVTWMMEGSLQERWVEENNILLYISDSSNLYISTERVSASVLAHSDLIYAQIGGEDYELIPRESISQEDMEDTAAGVALTTKFDFKVQPDPEVLTQGGNALVICRWRYQPNVLCVPRGAIFRSAQEHYVYVIEDGVMIRTPVEIGDGTMLRTQILSGVEEGQVVYVAE